MAGGLNPLGQVQGKSDSSGALSVSVQPKVGNASAPQNGLQIKVKTDASGNLLVANGA